MTAARRSLLALAVTALALGGVLVTAGPTKANAGFSFTRYAGANRYDTAAKIAIDSFGTADAVVIASGTSYPDALAGSYSAGLGNAPVLLTERDRLPQATSDALTTLKTTKAVIIGGTASVGPGAESAIKAKGITTSRVAGTTRYETSRKIATDAGTPGRLGTDSRTTALLVSGESFPDALSAGPISYAAHVPIVLTTSATLHPDAKAALQNVQRVVIVGGTTAVSPAVEADVRTMGADVERIAGVDRTDTAAKVADFEMSALGWPATHVELARGDDFPDALAGATHAGKNKAAALLTSNPTTLGAPTKSWLSAHAATLAAGHIDGGPGAVSQAVQDEATAAARTSSSSTTSSASSSSSSTSSSVTVPGSSTTTTASGGTTTTTNPLCNLGGIPVVC